MVIPMHVRVDEQSPIPIRRQLTEPRPHAIEGGGVLGSNPSTVASAIEDLRRSGCRPLAPGPEAPGRPGLQAEPSGAGRHAQDGAGV
jgi:hypothetical protein